MVHGAFCGGWVFEAFRRPFEAAGHQVVAPDLPGHGPGGDPAGLSMRDYADAVIRHCQALDAAPILIGHSLGGLACQLAAARAKPAAMILLAPSAPWGVYGSTMEEGASAISLYALGPFWLQSIAPDYHLARNYSLDRMSREARDAAFARMVPESGRALWETLNWWLDPFMTTQVGATPGLPVLAVAGGRDVIHPPATVRQTAARLSGTMETFTEMSHWLPAEPGWDTVADRCLGWLDRTLRAAA
ncbi:alpha/beta fold hydrolase [Caulobacter sp. SLTY]|uniref:alpha/beta fold hydrolase n=1 Tax=Caulobacter sp. SLTY TaxID=2683262 RepID=UPI00141323ED|nr:alpha/beta hydrolase [Caulobacter sp. SLTY]NBB14159.1 alpha/beta fold hydrolase [Caulobacter sp. SLTY]